MMLQHRSQTKALSLPFHHKHSASDPKTSDKHYGRHQRSWYDDPSSLLKVGVALFVLIPTVVLLFMRSNKLSHSTTLYHINSKHEEQYWPDVFVYVNYGHDFPSWPTKLSINTLRDIGGWKGDVIVITDKKQEEFAEVDCTVKEVEKVRPCESRKNDERSDD